MSNVDKINRRCDTMVLRAVTNWRVASLVCYAKPNKKINEKWTENKPLSPVKSNYP